MKGNTALFVFCLLLLQPGVGAQLPGEKVWVMFRDKPLQEHNPFEYLNSRSVDRRMKLGIPLADVADFPVSLDYISQTEEVGVKVLMVSRWLNAAVVKAGKNEREMLVALPFVASVEPVRKMKSSRKRILKHEGRLLPQAGELAERQLSLMEHEIFDSLGIDGRGVRIAVFDGGFPGVNAHPMFTHLREEGRIIATRDFVRGKEGVYHGSVHGTMVLSCIAGKTEEMRLGMASGAEFLLARTETWTEPYSEEENWVAAMEWADRLGADIISSSLGYTHHRYFPDQMDGEASLVSRAAGIAASKGILVVNAMGNEGSSRWKILGAPADADSILSVAGIDPFTGRHIAFSSFGPAADGTLKPNLTAPAHAAVAGKKKLRTAYGTSFSTPLVTGFAACVRQLHPEWKLVEWIQGMQEAGHLYPYYDYAHGFGLPRASRVLDTDTIVPAFYLMEEETSWVIEFTDALPKPGIPCTDCLYFHMASPGSIIRKYGVLSVEGSEPLYFPKEQLLPGEYLMVHYRGQTESTLNIHH